MQMKKLNGLIVVTALVTAFLGYCHFSAMPLTFTQERWKDAQEKNDRVTLYRMSKDLSDKIDNGLIRSRSEAEKILGVKELGRIGLSRPIYLILSEPWYLSLRFDDSDVLFDHGIYPD